MPSAIPLPDSEIRKLVADSLPLVKSLGGEVRAGWVETAMACPALPSEPHQKANQDFLFPHDAPGRRAPLARLSTCGITWERFAEQMGVDEPELSKPYDPRTIGKGTPAVVLTQRIAIRTKPTAFVVFGEKPSELAESYDSPPFLTVSCVHQVLEAALPGNTWVIGGKADWGRTGGVFVKKEAHQLTIVHVELLDWCLLRIHSVDGGQPGIKLVSREVSWVEQNNRVTEVWCGKLGTKWTSSTIGKGFRPDDGRRLYCAVDCDKLPYTSDRMGAVA